MNIAQTNTHVLSRCTRNMPFESVGTAAEHPSEPQEVVAVGDLDSTAKGSGARKNAGKTPYDLVPMRFHVNRYARLPHTPEDGKMWDALEAWQEGDDMALEHWLAICPDEWFDEAVKVLEFGARKYKAWNWACGMPWSVCTGCIIRHENKRILYEEKYDDDSGLQHIGHTVCNIIFLAHFNHMYREGDDRPPVYNEAEA